jgi:hypothetical protein
LQLGDEIRIGPHRFLLQAPGLRPERVLEPDQAQSRGLHWAWWAVPLLAAAGAAGWWWLQAGSAPLG